MDHSSASQKKNASRRAAPDSSAPIVENIFPEIQGGLFPVKTTAGQEFLVEADVFKDGHEPVRAALLFKPPAARAWSRAPMRQLENDRFQGSFVPREIGRYQYAIEAWSGEQKTGRSHSAALPLVVDRPQAAYGAWYEMFPRSQGRVPGKHGTFKDCQKRLSDIKRMGFDVIYLPPIHPIGKSHRKGPNNNLTPLPNSPGSVWAIGSSEGGHKAVHPELGTLRDFKDLVVSAREQGIEIALDYALQCSPDHPYVKEHPEWFLHRSDGTIQCAENPPKKYEDIYPFHFHGGHQRELWDELKSIVLFWIDQGVKVFRVDNPHTKPLRFWEWLIREVQEKHPETVFLAEAFTRPTVMKYLAKAGFTQSYSYFTWRNTKAELRNYLEELTTTDMRHYFRPNFFANTPDILHEYLQKGGRPAFKTRLVLAATLSPVYGIYSGFELCENRAVREGSEEYLDSEKYELKTRDWDQAGNIKDFIAKVNRARAEHPALREFTNLRFCESFNEQILCYVKKNSDNSDIIIAVVNLDPFRVQEDTVRLPLRELGLKEQDVYRVRDLLTDAEYEWRGSGNYVRLDPQQEPAHLFHLKK